MYLLHRLPLRGAGSLLSGTPRVWQRARSLLLSASVAICGALVSGLIGFAQPAEACSVCLAGDPNFNTQGTQAQEKGTVSVALEARGWTKKSGLLPHEEEEDDDHDDEEDEEHHDEREKNESQRLDLYVSWTPIDRLTLTVDVPYQFNKITEIEGDERMSFTHAGLGDVSFSASVVLWRDRPVLPGTWVEGRVLLKTPTGRSSKRVQGVKDPHLQVGTGSWDVGLGLGSVHRTEWGGVYGSLFYRKNQKGSLSYQYGDFALANVGSEVALGHALSMPALERVTLGGEMNFRWAAKDRSGGARWNDSGGSILYATPVVRIRLPWFEQGRAPVLRGSTQIPLTSSWLHGQQTEEVVWSVGLAYSF
jgi:hypothetical protein